MEDPHAMLHLLWTFCTSSSIQLGGQCVMLVCQKRMAKAHGIPRKAADHTDITVEQQQESILGRNNACYKAATKSQNFNHPLDVSLDL